MISLKKIKLKSKLNKLNLEQELLHKGYNHYDLAAFYITGFKGLNIPIKSSLRSNDKNASLNITSSRTGKIIISDFGLKIGMDIYEYINRLYFNGTNKNFRKVLGMIQEDFNLNNLESYSNKKISFPISILPTKHNKLIKDKQSVKLEVKRSRIDSKINWSEKDTLYWEQYGISTNYLETKNVAPLDTFWITNPNKNNIRSKYNVVNELCYVYPSFRDKKGNFMYSIYLPKGLKYNKDFKWVKNVTKKVIQNIKHIPTNGELLIIQSSNKDIYVTEILAKMCNIELSVICPNGEGIWFDEIQWNKLKTNWKNIILFGNNDSNKPDNPGLSFARKHSNQYKIPFVVLPNNTTSDISDYRAKNGVSKTIPVFKNIISNIHLIITEWKDLL